MWKSEVQRTRKQYHVGWQWSLQKKNKEKSSLNVSWFKSVAFLTSPSQCLMHVLSIFFYQDELKRLKNIERNTNRLKELGLWEYAPKKPKGKGSRKHTVSLGRKQQLLCRKGNKWYGLFHTFSFTWISIFRFILTVNWDRDWQWTSKDCQSLPCQERRWTYCRARCKEVLSMPR